MLHVQALRLRGIRLATTDRNAFELRRNLIGTLGLSEEEADMEVERVLAPFELILSDDYHYLRVSAQGRLREGGKPDWPALAAAMALDGQIWSEDVDFFGVGVPVWSTGNVRFAQAEENE